MSSGLNSSFLILRSQYSKLKCDVCIEGVIQYFHCIFAVQNGML